MKRKFDQWIYRLNPGEYTLSELQKISGKTKSNLCQMLKKLDVAKCYILAQKKEKVVCEVIYHWKGINNDTE